MDVAGKAAKWDELLPKLGILRANLFRVDRQLSHLDQELFDKDPVQVVDYTSAFLSVLELYFPSTEEEALAAGELTRLERLGQELSQTGDELKEEVKREFASLRAQVETEIGRLEAENARLRLSENILTGAAAQLKAELSEALDELARLRPYADPRLRNAAAEAADAYEAALDFDQLAGIMERLAEAVDWWDGLPGVASELPLEAVERIAAGEDLAKVLAEASDAGPN